MRLHASVNSSQGHHFINGVVNQDKGLFWWHPNLIMTTTYEIILLFLFWVLQPEFKMDSIEMLCLWPAHNTALNVKVELQIN